MTPAKTIHGASSTFQWWRPYLAHGRGCPHLLGQVIQDCATVQSTVLEKRGRKHGGASSMPHQLSPYGNDPVRPMYSGLRQGALPPHPDTRHPHPHNCPHHSIPHRLQASSQGPKTPRRHKQGNPLPISEKYLKRHLMSETQSKVFNRKVKRRLCSVVSCLLAGDRELAPQKLLRVRGPPPKTRQEAEQRRLQGVNQDHSPRTWRPRRHRLHNKVHERDPPSSKAPHRLKGVR